MRRVLRNATIAVFPASLLLSKGQQRITKQLPEGTFLLVLPPQPGPAWDTLFAMADTLEREGRVVALVEAAKERLARPLGKQRLVERKTYVEDTFGLAKELHGLRRTRFRGRHRVRFSSG